MIVSKPVVATWSLAGLLVSEVADMPAQQRGGDSTAARVALTAALDVLGPDAAAKRLPGLWLRGTGTRTWIGQGLSVDEPAVIPLAMEWIVDFRLGRARRWSTVSQGRLPYFSIVSYYTPERSFHREAVTDILISVPPATGERSRRAALARFPEPRSLIGDLLGEGVVLSALERRQEGGRTLDVVNARSERTGAWRVFIDPQSHLIVRAERPEPIAMVLDTVLQSIEFGDFTDVAGIKLASWVRETTPTSGTIGAVIVDEYRYTDVRAPASFSDSLFEAPRRAFPRQPDGRITLRELAQDVVLIENARPNYNQLAVAFDDFLLVVDAPFSTTVADTVLASLATRFPGKPVRYVVSTHFHYDHVGGVPRYVEDGARIVTTSGSAAFMRDLVARDAAFRGRSMPTVSLETVRDSLVIRDDRQQVVLYRIEPTEHVEEMLVVSIPSARALYVADVVSADWGRLRPAIPETVQFHEWLERHDLDVDVILPGHGPPVDRAGLEWAVEEGRAMERDRAR